MLITTTYYSVPREEDGRPNADFKRLWEYAMCWHPEIEEPSDRPSGLSALHQLRDGNAVPSEKLAAAHAYLVAAIDFYLSNPWGGSQPYEGRNEQAAQDFQNLLEELTV